MKQVPCKSLEKFFRGPKDESVWRSAVGTLLYGSRVGIAVVDTSQREPMTTVASIKSVSEGADCPICTGAAKIVLAISHESLIEYQYGFRGSGSDERVHFQSSDLAELSSSFAKGGSTTVLERGADLGDSRCAELPVDLTRTQFDTNQSWNVDGFVDLEPVEANRANYQKLRFSIRLEHSCS